jgi:crotonobetainyl-CoA:carnitine CoA-transferase CaiB-like acyl-CoA transferase
MTSAKRLRVVDLSALWAGPLCGRLFSEVGAEVIKVESPRRPDAARFGSPGLFDRLHRGQEILRLDFDAPGGLDTLIDLLENADVVIEASRPRALEQRGVFAAELVARRPGLTWISITAYGRSGEQGAWVGFGDDVAASAGLIALDVSGDPVFLGDAIADPISGLTAAREGMQAVAAGGGLVAVSMHDAAAAIACLESRNTRVAA